MYVAAFKFMGHISTQWHCPLTSGLETMKVHHNAISTSTACAVLLWCVSGAKLSGLASCSLILNYILCLQTRLPHRTNPLQYAHSNSSVGWLASTGNTHTVVLPHNVLCISKHCFKPINPQGWHGKHTWRCVTCPAHNVPKHTYIHMYNVQRKRVCV